jgi:ABC-2 type transport system permease protein
VIIAIGSVQSLVAIMAIYREGGILKRLRATPLSPVTILGAHVVVKLGFTVCSLGLLVLAGKRLFPGVMQVNLLSFTVAVLVSTLGILSLGFVIASLVPTARFAQPIGALVLYPMLAVSGLFFPSSRLPPAVRAVAQVLPTTHAVALLQGVWDGSGWGAHWVDAAALLALFLGYCALSTRVFRWE